MDQLVLEAEPRTIKGKQVNQLRRQGLVPAVVYGKATAPIPVQVPRRPLELVLSKAGESTLISLRVADRAEPLTVLVRDQQRDALTQVITHVDFYAVVMTETIRARIPLVLEGEPPVLQKFQGVLLQQKEEVEVECLPKDLVPHITVDVSTLQTFDDSIYVKDLVLPAGIQVLDDPEELVATVSPVAEEAVEAEAAPAEPGEVEVIKKGKKEEEQAEAEE
jgi:large subunit ribosomal protein L25